MPFAKSRKSVAGNLLAGAFGVAALAIFAALPAGATGIEGQVRVGRGGANPANVVIWLESSGGSPIDQKIADTEGRFEFRNLSQSLYFLKVEAKGFNPLRKEVDLTNTPGTAFVEVYLTPQEKNEAAAAAPLRTDEAAPRKAKKEFEKGRHALEEKDLATAADQLEKAVSEYPCYARAQTELATVYVLQKENEHAEAALKKSIECDSGYLVAYSRYAILLNGEKRFRECQAMLEGALRLGPADWELHYQLGAALAGQEQYAGALDEYRKAQSFNSDVPAEVHARLADTYLRMGAPDKAYPEMQAYLAMEPNGRFAERIRTVMSNLEAKGIVKPAPPASP